ncbi:MAG: hypothetical protein ACUVRL_07140 [Candidatus Saccharicenans sp.]|uniref:hypothetical protein n=1 Tax=Candidatus Saccharicenans sp. TaxID=2819258 RepID=UPI00404B7D32
MNEAEAYRLTKRAGQKKKNELRGSNEEEGGKRRRIFLPLPFLSNLGLAST